MKSAERPLLARSCRSKMSALRSLMEAKRKHLLLVLSLTGFDRYC